MCKPDIRIINSSFLASAVRKEQYPESILSQAAFIGRSNVGKSSLINSLCQHGGLARTSGTPGKTQTLNFYNVNVKIRQDNGEENRDAFMLVDLPGYGYAKTSRSSRRQWADFIEKYLTNCPHIKIIFQLIDVRHPPMASDIQSFQWLKEKKLPVAIVATKADKITKSNYNKNLKVIKTELGILDEEIILYSSLTGYGRDKILMLLQKQLWHFNGLTT